jgi:hypothetical protein
MDGADERMMSRLPDSVVMRQGAHGPSGASIGLKGKDAVRQIDFGDWWGVGFSTRLVRLLQPPSRV